MASMAVVVFVMAVRRRKKTGERERAPIGNGGAAGVRLGASTEQRQLRCYGDGGLLGAHGDVVTEGSGEDKWRKKNEERGVGERERERERLRSGSNRERE
jgi:hypothetical protein